MSTAKQQAMQPLREKGRAAEEIQTCMRLDFWFVAENVPDCHCGGALSLEATDGVSRLSCNHERLPTIMVFLLEFYHLEEIDMRRVLALVLALALCMSFAACGAKEEPAAGTPSDIPGLEDGVLTVGMECQYAPYNWTQMNDANGAVPIVNNPGAYANGYDVMMAQKICDAYGWKLEVMALEWGGLTPALASGTIDVAIAGQSMTAERMAEVDMAGPYYYATIVCMAKAGSANASATSIAELSGNCTSQSGTIWYDSCLPQIAGAGIQSPAASAPDMIMALESGTVDFICTDLPTANSAAAKNPELVVLDFSGTEGDFQFASEAERAENVNIGVSVQKGNARLQEAINAVLGTMTADDFNTLMDEAIAAVPEI